MSLRRHLADLAIVAVLFGCAAVPVSFALAQSADRAALEALGERGIARVRVVPGTSCERMAEMTFAKADEIVREATKGWCWVESVECSEHGSNSAIYRSVAAMERLAESDRLRAGLD